MKHYETLGLIQVIKPFLCFEYRVFYSGCKNSRLMGFELIYTFIKNHLQITNILIEKNIAV